LLGPLAISMGVVGCLIMVEHLKNHKIYRMDLGSGAALPAADARFIYISGYISGAVQEDYEYALAHKENSTANSDLDEMKYYTPLKCRARLSWARAIHNWLIRRYRRSPKLVFSCLAT